MAEALPHFPSFEPGSDGGDVTVHWRKWVSRFKNLMVASKTKGSVAALCRRTCEQYFNTFDVGDPNEEQNLVDKAIEALTVLFAENKLFEIYKFRLCKQERSETIAAYHTTLQQMANTCDFHDKKCEVKTQIIHSCVSNKLYRRSSNYDTHKNTRQWKCQINKDQR